MSCFNLVNVIWYDGCDAYVDKFILPCDHGRVTAEGEERCEKYIEGNGKILEYDVLYPLTFQNILAFKDCDDVELKCALERYGNMFFVV